MATIEEELAVAKEAKAAVDRPRVQALRKATQMATRQKTTLSGEALLNAARDGIGFALPPLIAALEKGEASQGEKGRAKEAIEAWIRELEAAKR